MKRNRAKHTFLPEEIIEMKRLYIEEKLGTPAIGKIFNVDKGKINRTLKANGVVLDTSGRRNLGGKVAASKRYYKKNKEDLNNYYKEWRKDKQDKLREYHKEWRKDNPEFKQGRVDYERNRKRENPKYRLGARTRTALWTCLKERNVAKYRSTFDLLGYTLEELMVHLEKQFTLGMTWENYGEWHVDHKIPMAKFVFETTDDHEFHLCWCLNNLQPLWATENLVKGSRIVF